MILAYLSTLVGFLAQPIELPDPPPQAPPGKLGDAVSTMLSWMKWGGFVLAIAAGMAAGIMMAIGRRNRNNMAIDAAMGVPWIIAGIAFVSGSTSLVAFFVA